MAGDDDKHNENNDDKRNEHNEGENHVNAVFAKLPFPQLNSPANIETWFLKIEEWFKLQGLGVRKESEKFSAIIAYLDQKYLDPVHDLIVNPPPTQPYTTLKTAILAKFAESEMARLDKLSGGIQLGDSRPSHLLSQLQRLNATNDATVVRRYRIKRLPAQARAVVVGMLESNPDITLEQCAKTADAVMDSLTYAGDIASIVSVANNTIEKVNQGAGNNVSAIATNDVRIGQLEKTVDKHETTLQQINSKLGQLLSQNRSRTRERSQSNYRGNRSNTPHQSSNGIESPESPFCWYHTEYGKRARKCDSPCTYNQIQNTTNQQNNNTQPDQKN